MTFLSRLELQPRSLHVIRDVGDPAQMHKTVMRAFPAVEGGDRPPRAALGVLYRLEELVMLVQSAVAPDWMQLPAGYLRDVASKEIDQALGAIATGLQLRFLLVANVTRKVAREGARHSQRVPLATDDARHAWLVRRAERAGFVLAGAGPHDGVRIDPIVSPRPIGSRIVVDAVRFEGRLVVTDATRFLDAVRTGIGPAKAFGCGLVSVAPV